MKIHIKKLTQPYFDDVWYDKKKFELRKNDCDYTVGDFIVLKEYDQETISYSGRKIEAIINYLLKDYPGIENGYCILGISILDRYRTGDKKL